MQPLDDRRYLAKLGTNAREMLACEAVLGEGLKGFLAELMMVNGGVMVSYINNNQHANLDDIIGSSMEHRIKPGRLCYSNHAQVDFDWGEAPSVALGMELRDERLTAFFRVVFGADHVGVDLDGIHFVDHVGDAAENLRRLAAAVADARIP
jgi:hypothetical protein